MKDLKEEIWSMDENVVYALPTIREISDCEREFPDTIIISKIRDYEEFDDLYYKVYYAICACIEIPRCVSFPIKFKFYQEDPETYQLSMTKFLFNLNAWRPLVLLKQLQ